ncbi:MAG: hypothetical protein ABGY41_21450 [Candidatus Poribacteria bacterium]
MMTDRLARMPLALDDDLVLRFATEADADALAAFNRHGVPIDRGHGQQVLLPDAYWGSESSPPPVAPQLSLFDVGEVA